MERWYAVGNVNDLISPALLVYPDRIRENIRSMIAIAGSADRLRPHVKTYKCAGIIGMQLEAGISRFKCATLPEAALAARCGAKDILLAYPLVGPVKEGWLRLRSEFPDVSFSFLVDHPDQLREWRSLGHKNLNVYIDLDVGMHRTGISCEKAASLYQDLTNGDTFVFRGWHVYDGHLQHEATEERSAAAEQAFAPVLELMAALSLPDHTEIVCGGSISFPLHAGHQNRILSPGTTLLWDHGYGSRFPDLPFDIAAVLVTRVVSKPGDDRLCLDLGHKAVASEMKAPCVFFPDLPDAVIEKHSEEHLVVASPGAGKWNIGDVLYGFPYHICPTVALHEEVGVVQDGRLEGFWTIEARTRMYHL